MVSRWLIATMAAELGSPEATRSSPTKLAAEARSLQRPARPVSRRAEPLRGEQLTLPVVCPQCGGAMVQPATGRPRRWCSQACAARAKRRRQAGLPVSVPVVERHGWHTTLREMAAKKGSGG